MFIRFVFSFIIVRFCFLMTIIVKVISKFVIYIKERKVNICERKRFYISYIYGIVIVLSKLRFVEGIWLVGGDGV